MESMYYTQLYIKKLRLEIIKTAVKWHGGAASLTMVLAFLSESRITADLRVTLIEKTPSRLASFRKKWIIRYLPVVCCVCYPLKIAANLASSISTAFIAS